MRLYVGAIDCTISVEIKHYWSTDNSKECLNSKGKHCKCASIVWQQEQSHHVVKWSGIDPTHFCLKKIEGWNECNGVKHILLEICHSYNLEFVACWTEYFQPTWALLLYSVNCAVHCKAASFLYLLCCYSWGQVLLGVSSLFAVPRPHSHKIHWWDCIDPVYKKTKVSVNNMLRAY